MVDFNKLNDKDLEDLINGKDTAAINFFLEWTPLLGLYFVPRNLRKHNNFTEGKFLTINAIYHAYITFYLLPELAIKYLN